MQYALFRRQTIKPIFHFCGQMAEKFNIIPVKVVFLNTCEVIDPVSEDGKVIRVSKKGRDDGPISDVNFKLGWKLFSLFRKS